jgi:hypothetical protein
LEHGIDGKIYHSIKAVYETTRACIVLNNKLSTWFITKSGVRQGDSLSPTLFAIFINDLIDDLKSANASINIMGREICALMYADDVVILSNYENGLQRLLSTLGEWCKKWDMKINYLKSGVMHFRNIRAKRSSRLFHIGDNAIEYVSNYKYLGVYIDEHMKFDIAATNLAKSGSRALGALLSKFKLSNDMGFKTFEKLYENCVIPVLLKNLLI